MSTEIEELNSQIKELRSEKIFLSTHLSVLMENYYQNRSSENIVKMDELREEINEIDSNLNPLLIKF